MFNLTQNELQFAADRDSRSVVLLTGSKFGRENMVDIALLLGANANAKDFATIPALYHAAQNGHERIVEKLVRFGANVNEALKWGVLFEQTQVVKDMLRRGGDVNTRITLQFGVEFPILFAAARHGEEEMVKLLLKYGAKLECGPEGWTPLLAATAMGNTGTVKILLKHGAKVDCEVNGKNLMTLAASKGKLEIMEALLQHGAKVDGNREGKFTALMAAAKKGRTRTARWLIEHGANVNATYFDGENLSTPLGMAARGGHEAVMKVLKEHGARVVASFLLETKPKQKRRIVVRRKKLHH